MPQNKSFSVEQNSQRHYGMLARSHLCSLNTIKINNQDLLPLCKFWPTCELQFSYSWQNSLKLQNACKKLKKTSNKTKTDILAAPSTENMRLSKLKAGLSWILTITAEQTVCLSQKVGLMADFLAWLIFQKIQAQCHLPFLTLGKKACFN